MRLSTLIAAVLMAAMNVATAWADTYPTRPIRLVVPYPAGGATDILARQVAAKLGPILGQNVIIENKPGASGVIGFDSVARATPDGYTLLMGTANMIINAAFGKVPYDPVKDFAPVSTLVSSQNLLVVRPSLNITRLSELIALARKEPGKLTYGTSGVGTPLITMELLKSLAGIDMRSVPYRGDAPATTDVLSGQIDMYASTIAGLRGYIDGKQLVPLGVTSQKRAVSLPDIPTIAEAGVPGYELNSWYGILAPRRTPPEIVERLNKLLVEIVATPEMQKQMIDGGADPMSSTTAQFEALMASDLEKYTRLVRDLKLGKE
ncbi:Bug family tripartite tricarboxylate transporter substrate binding protein [uncultured Enterovirga sp.]|uniref:Bug family tripartite tricarboxylate transporter substrate binding protein n=1 Tax=uncultured Enterovirga sp. TaxID=2026352 RepID=UPI0035CA5EE9